MFSFIFIDGLSNRNRFVFLDNYRLGHETKLNLDAQKVIKANK